MHLSNHTVRCRLSGRPMSCDVFDHVAAEIRSDKAKVTLQLQ